MIRIEGVSHHLSTPAGILTALDNINLTIDRGEAVALMGANGSGKSTLCRCLNGLIVPEKGSVRVDGLETRDGASAGKIRRSVGMVFQNPSQQLVTWSVEEEVAFGLENLTVPSAKIDSVVERILGDWGLRGVRGRHPIRLSGGQMARVALAAVMAMDPSYLVVDEPTSLLDTQGRATLLRLISQIRARGDVGLLWVTQFPEEVALFDRLIVMSHGRVVADDCPDDILDDHDKLSTWGLEAPAAVLLASALRRRGIVISEGTFTMEPLLRELESLGLSSPLSCESGQTKPERRGHTLSMSGVWCGYPGGPDVLKDVSVEVGEGEGLGLVGRSGSGKSTFLFAAAGALRPRVGTIVRTPEGGNAVGAGLGLAVQLPEEGFCAPTVIDEVALALQGRGLPSDQIRLKLKKSLEMVGLDYTTIGMRSPLSLSEGEKKKVALASALAPAPGLLLLDEPIQGLDGPSAAKVLMAVREHMEAGGTAIIASHNADFLLCATEGLLALDGGAVVESGDWAQWLQDSGRSALLPWGQMVAASLWIGQRPPPASLRSVETGVEHLSEHLSVALSRTRDPSSLPSTMSGLQGGLGPQSGRAPGKTP
jgi:energy-coupling factor transport system ATP-binding protein